ncbi:MAG: hypothetical protein HKN67_05375 [Saprospiraceae bacterium]|nr:hypothetical protein [Saprospiraceae bacterium]
MRQINIPEFHKTLVSQNQEISHVIESVSKQAQEILIKSPDPGKWSIMECFEHMNILYEVYINNIKEAIGNGKEKYGYTDHFKPTLVGHYFFLSMAPNEERKPRFKIKTFKRFEPSGRNFDSIDKFRDYHREFSELIDWIPELNLDKIKVTSSIGNIIRFKLGDAFRIVTGHNQRHIIQVQRALETLS